MVWNGVGEDDFQSLQICKSVINTHRGVFFDVGVGRGGKRVGMSVGEDWELIF